MRSRRRIGGWRGGWCEADGAGAPGCCGLGGVRGYQVDTGFRGATVVLRVGARRSGDEYQSADTSLAVTSRLVRAAGHGRVLA
jgi:hypothetical protein